MKIPEFNVSPAPTCRFQADGGVSGRSPSFPPDGSAMSRLGWSSALVGLVGTLACRAGAVPAQVPHRGPGIIVQVYNWVAPPQTLAPAENEAARIFHEAGVTVSWLNCPSDDS